MMMIINSNTHPTSILKVKLLEEIGSDYTNIKEITLTYNGKFSYFKESIKLVLKIIKIKPDQILLNEFWFFFPFITLFISKKTKLIYYSGNINYDVLRTLGYNKFIIKIVKFLEISIIKKSTIILSDSISLINFFKQYNKKELMFYIPEYVDNSIHRDQQALNYKNHSRLKDNGLIHICYISSIHLIKLENGTILPRGWELIEIAEKLIKHNITNFNIFIIGDGNGSQVLKNMVIEKELSKFFAFTGFVDSKEKENLLNNMDIGFCEDYVSFLTHQYNLSSKIQEYMLSGMAIITGNQGDKKLIIDNLNYPCGICVNPFNDNKYSSDISRYINDLAISFLTLIRDNNLLDKFKCNALIQGERLFSKKQVTLDIKEVFDYLFL